MWQAWGDPVEGARALCAILGNAPGLPSPLRIPMVTATSWALGRPRSPSLPEVLDFLRSASGL